VGGRWAAAGQLLGKRRGSGSGKAVCGSLRGSWGSQMEQLVENRVITMQKQTAPGGSGWETVTFNSCPTAAAFAIVRVADIRGRSRTFAGDRHCWQPVGFQRVSRRFASGPAWDLRGLGTN